MRMIVVLVPLLDSGGASAHENRAQLPSRAWSSGPSCASRSRATENNCVGVVAYPGDGSLAEEGGGTMPWLILLGVILLYTILLSLAKISHQADECIPRRDLRPDDTPERHESRG